MIKFLEHTLILIAVVLLQVLLFDNLYIGSIVIINISALFIVTLPIELAPWKALIISAISGVVLDIFSGTPGIYTISATALGFVRPPLMTLVFGKGDDTLRGVISSNRYPLSKYITFIAMLIALQNIIIFSLETLSFGNMLGTILRILTSTITSVAFVYILQIPLFRKER